MTIYSEQSMIKWYPLFILISYEDILLSLSILLSIPISILRPCAYLVQHVTFFLTYDKVHSPPASAWRGLICVAAHYYAIQSLTCHPTQTYRLLCQIYHSYMIQNIALLYIWCLNQSLQLSAYFTLLMFHFVNDFVFYLRFWHITTAILIGRINDYEAMITNHLI